MSIAENNKSAVPSPANWAESSAGKAIATGILAAEISPLNEAIRVGAATAAFALSHDAVVATAAASVATAVIEGGAGIATADLLHTTTGKTGVDKFKKVLSKIGLHEGLKTNSITDAAVALLGGTAISTFVKHQQGTDRTREDDRKFAIKSAGGLTAYTAATTYMVASGFESPNPVTVGAATLAVGGLVGVFNWAKKRITEANQSAPVPSMPETSHKKANYGEAPHRLGLTSEDIGEAAKDERTLSVVEGDVTKPVLVPIDRLYWYNKKYLAEHFGTDNIYYYAHPDIADKDLEAKSYGYIKDVIANKGVVLYDTVTAGDTVYGDLDQELSQRGMEHQRAEVSKDGKKRWLAQYEGKFVVRKHPEASYANDSTLFETYEQSVRNGEIKYDPQTGPALLDVVEGDEAERLWKIYEGPFEKLSASHPIASGYKKHEFIEMLSDPSTLKAVYRENGSITTLAFFVNNLDHCDWLDKEYYQKNYPEAMKTNNVYVFPGIVTDELKRGAAYSVPIMELLSKVQAIRKTPAIIAFECTEVSSKYIPRIVQFAINKSGAAKIKEVTAERSRLDYYAITAA